MKIDLEKLGTGSSSLDEYHLNSFKVFRNFDNDLKILVFCFLRRYILLFILERIGTLIRDYRWEDLIGSIKIRPSR